MEPINPSGLTPASNSPAGTNAKAIHPNAKLFVDTVTGHAGQFIQVSWASQPKPKAEFKDTVLRKVTDGIFRTGIDYSQIGVIKNAIEAGERGKVQSLPKGQDWVIFPHVIETKNGNLLALTTCEGQKSKVQYFVNGEEVSKENFESYLVPSALKKPETPLVRFTIKAENLISVKGVKI